MYEIIGVASDMGYFSSDVWDPERPMPFVPEAQSTHFEEADLESREIWCDPNLVGLYGVTAYGAEQRSGELGVRMALGADWGNVVRMVLRAAFGKSGSGWRWGFRRRWVQGGQSPVSCLEYSPGIH